MSRRRSDQGTDASERRDRSRLRSRRRRRRIGRGFVRLGFWTLVLAGVFVLGIGYGKTLSGQDELRGDKVTVDVDRGPIQATLPTRTVTVTKTVRVKAKPVRRTRAATR